MKLTESKIVQLRRDDPLWAMHGLGNNRRLIYFAQIPHRHSFAGEEFDVVYAWLRGQKTRAHFGSWVHPTRTYASRLLSSVHAMHKGWDLETDFVKAWKVDRWYPMTN